MAQPGAVRGERGDERAGAPVGLAALCCLPTLLIAAILLAAGGVSIGIFVPALMSGAMIGMLTFISIREGPSR